MSHPFRYLKKISKYHTHDGDATAKINHTNLDGRYTANQHRIANITDLESTLDDKLNTVDAIEVFSYAAYLSLRAPVNSAFPNLSATYQDLNILTEVPIPPRYVTSGGNSQFSFQHEGVYVFSFSGSIEHNSSNSGRLLYLRIWNSTDSIAVGSGIVFGTGRNAEATPLGANTLFNISAAGIGKLYGLQIGGGDSYSSVNFQAAGLTLFNVGEWKEPISGAGG